MQTSTAISARDVIIIKTACMYFAQRDHHEISGAYGVIFPYCYILTYPSCPLAHIRHNPCDHSTRYQPCSIKQVLVYFVQISICLSLLYVSIMGLELAKSGNTHKQKIAPSG
ncbi:hypothetical protein F4777DRAFT_18317 [Nemania sp. FL0916]|nr:hypothetical protein F4777DRAFT_18317 [Nemania sp. FL0916]